MSARRGDVLRDNKVFSSGAEMGAIVDTECHCTCRISCCTFGGIRKLAGLFRCPLKRRKAKRSSENESFHQIVALQSSENVGTRSNANRIELKPPRTPPPPPPPGHNTARDSSPRLRASFVPTADMLVDAKSKLKSLQAASSTKEDAEVDER
ncbi:hypothetical protein BSKO_13753 [Bryopsis sp. KO-2023]|nr:hypothetical protein BSKO_13753 [Bryopsis sp. KO-2023]